MKVFRIASLLLTSIGVVWAATVPFAYECSKESGFVMDPTEHKRVGYITNFDGLGLTLQKDLQVNLPFKPAYQAFGIIQGNPPACTAKVAGVIEKFEWNGGVSDPIVFEFYVSQQNAMLLKARMQSTLSNTSISGIGWWIGNFDQETKTWFEQHKPSSSPSLKAVLQVGSAQPRLSVDLTPVPVKDGIDVNVYKVSIGIVPVAHSPSTLFFANSPTMKVTKTWGLP